MRWNVKFADGMVFEVKSISPYGDSIWIDLITDRDFMQTVMYLDHEENTTTITYYLPDKPDSAQVFEGYTIINSVSTSPTRDGFLISLRKSEVDDK